MPSAGRRPGHPDTRGAILDAARTVFAEAGYNNATLRDIAARAGVDPSLVIHYFGSKADLYASVIEFPLPTSEALKAVVTGEREEVGQRLTALFFSVWENASAREPLLAILRGALEGNEQAVAGFREFIAQTVMPGVARASGADDQEIGLAMAHLLGVAVLRYVVRLEPVASMDLASLTSLIAPRIQSYLSQSPG